MQMLKRMILMIFVLTLCASGSLVANAQTDSEALQNVQQKLLQQAQEKQAINKDISSLQQEMQSLYTYISKNKDDMAKTQGKIAETNKLIEAKKEEIVTLEDNILGRKAVMKQRLKALQHDDKVSLVINVLLESKSFDDLLQRASAVSALFDADKDILGAQEDDLKKIEADKKVIDQQEETLLADQNVLAKQQAELAQNLQKRQAMLADLQQKYTEVAQKIAATESEKAGIEAQIKAAQERILREQAAAKAAAAAKTTATTAATPTVSAGKGVEMYVTATAYSPDESGSYTTLGYNIKANPNMKLIAVDPSVIPLGSKVWVEGYGEAIAGDTGGAIVGHKIDVLKPNRSAALSWGRKTVKLVILN